MSLCIRYIEDNLIREDFLTFIPIYNASGKRICWPRICLCFFKKWNILYYNGVQKNINDIIPQALYVHCAGHSLTLAVSKSCNISKIRNSIGSIFTIISNKIRSFKKVQKKNLIPDTRKLF